MCAEVLEKSGHKIGSEVNGEEQERRCGTEDDVRRQIGSRCTAWFISVQETNKYISIFYMQYYIYSRIYSEKCFVGHLNNKVFPIPLLPQSCVTKILK